MTAIELSETRFAIEAAYNRVSIGLAFLLDDLARLDSLLVDVEGDVPFAVQELQNRVNLAYADIRDSQIFIDLWGEGMIKEFDKYE